MVSVIGTGLVPFGKHNQETLVDLGTLAARCAIVDAGITAGEIDIGFFANAMGAMLFGDMTLGQRVMAQVGVRRVPVINVENACTSGSSALHLAYGVIAAGQAETALVVGAEKMHVPGLGLISSGASDLDSQLGLVTPASFALRAARHMYEFGTTVEQLAQVSVKNRRHAAANPYAQFRQPITVDEVLNSPMIAEPLTRLQCCPIADGAAAVVLVAAKNRQKNGRSVQIKGSVLCSGSYENPPDLATWETDFRGARLAYEATGVGPEDLDLIECHDAFSIAEILHYEALGLCEIGAGGRLVESGETTLSGRIPVNVSGGLLSRGHPVAATGIAQVIEIVGQLRHEAGERQVENAKVGLAHCMGGDLFGDAKSCTVLVLTR